MSPLSINNRPLPEDIISQRGSLGMELLRSDAVTFSDSEAVSTESSVRLSAEDDEISESSSWVVCLTGQSEGKSKFFEASHTLLVTTRIGLMVNGIEILCFQCGGLPSTSHCLMVHRQQVDLIGARRA